MIAGFCSSVQKRITNTAACGAERNCPSKKKIEKSKCHTMKLLNLPVSPRTYSTTLTHPQRVPFLEASLSTINTMFLDNRGSGLMNRKTK